MSCNIFFSVFTLKNKREETYLEKIGTSRELKGNFLTSELLVDSGEGIELVLERGGILVVEETM